MVISKTLVQDWLEIVLNSHRSALFGERSAMATRMPKNIIHDSVYVAVISQAPSYMKKYYKSSLTNILTTCAAPNTLDHCHPHPRKQTKKKFYFEQAMSSDTYVKEV